jgi:thiazole synthase
MLKIANKLFNSRLLLGTGKFSSGLEMKKAIEAAGSELITVALKRVDLKCKQDNILSFLQDMPNLTIMPNTSGARTAKEAIFASEIAREALETNWIKLEIHPDPKYLMPDPVETLKAAENLVNLGFVVLPYVHADPVLCKRLEEVGVAAVMPLGAPIGTNKGLKSKTFLEIIIEQSNIPVIVDAGLGAPSHAAEAIEMGADAVLVNTAIAVADEVEKMAKAFKLAVEAGALAKQARLGAVRDYAESSSPLTAFLDSQ